ncbi:MAG: bifunctional demethylmenaquinone methyltransferase/2-methoxy-6-polyprenyl-1,4-benzoquinol methylase UbiE [Pseudomonadota bacterium]|nr:bifunctional demethylmenaquinone methyltransferase/2-methoxy-6-polyprenyl-1,4-benzoquinol methylase UbiE [Pseudomonadota bacterium]
MSACKISKEVLHADILSTNLLNMSRSEKTSPVDFGFEKVAKHVKTEKVQQVFSGSAENYDLMNEIMSLGMHTHWKKKAVEYTHLYPGDMALDLACGSCDITQYLHQSQPKAHIIATDPNANMLDVGRDRLLNHGIHKPISFVMSFAEHLPFKDQSFNLVICAFGFRNFTDQDKGLNEIYRVLKPGGQIVILEFSKPQAQIIDKLYQGYASIIPEIGQWIAQQKHSYQYLIESIEKQMSPETLQKKLQETGFEAVKITKLLSGLIGIYRGIKC